MGIKMGSKKGERNDKDFIVKVISSRHRGKKAEVTFRKSKAKMQSKMNHRNNVRSESEN